MRGAAWLAVLLVLPMGGAQGERVVDLSWEWRFSLPDPASGKVRVALALSGGDGAITRFTFHLREGVTDLAGGPGTPLEVDEAAGAFSFEVDGDESFSYETRVERPAFKPGEVLQHAGADFALFKAESATLSYSYRFYEGIVVRNATTVRIDPPPGWQEAAPWRRTEDGAYALAGSESTPRGFVVMGPFRGVDQVPVGGRVFQHVRLGATPAYATDMRAYLEKATPYYRAVYGATPARVLLVSAPDPMFRGGLGATDSLFLHESADLRTLAHEYAHVHQRFGTEEAVGQSSIWLAEGDADWHAALSLHAADLWSASQVQQAFDEAEADRRVAAFADVRLDEVTYGMTTPDGRSLERFAYHKGAVVLRALDAELADRGGVAEVLRRLNARHGDPTREAGGTAVGNAEAREVAEAVAGRDLDAFFARHVHGTAWPEPPRFRAEGDLVVEGLAVDPARASPGEPARATLVLANQGTRSVQREVQLLVDGAVVATRQATLPVGGSTTLSFDLVAGPPGDHEVRALYATATLHSLFPASLSLASATSVPARPSAGAPTRVLAFVENAGEEAGAARVEVRAGNATLSASPETVVEPGATDVVTLLFPAPGPGVHDLTLVLRAGGREATRALVLDVGPPDADLDGVPDADDAYPGNPTLSRKSVANDVRDAPSPGLVATLVVLAALAAARRRQ